MPSPTNTTAPLAGPPCSHAFLQTESDLPISEDIVDSRLQIIECYSQLPKLLNGGSLDFLVEASNVESTCLLESFLHLKLRVVKFVNGVEKDLDDKDMVSYSPFITNTLFKGVSLSINDEPVNMNMEQYQAYEGILNTILYLSREEQERFLAGSGLYLSPPNTHEYTDPTPDPTLGSARNTALAERHSLVQYPHIGFTAPILWPLFLVPRLLPTKVELKLSLSLNTPEMALIAHPYEDTEGPEGDHIPAPALPNFNIRIDSAQLYLQRYRLSPTASATQERILNSSGGCRYPLTVNHTTTFNLAADVTEISKSLTMGTPIPRMIYVYHCYRDQVNNILTDPFEFQNCDIAEIFLEIDGKKFPQGLSYSPEFTTGNYYKDFRLFQREMNYVNSNLCFKIDDWESGYCIFAFNLIPDRSFGCDYINPLENPNGTVTLHIRYRTPLSRSTTVFVTSEMQKVLCLDSNRKPRWE